jgi:cobalt-precorrin-6B (C15)-methyltransferase
VQFYTGEAADFLRDCGPLQAAFVGGSRNLQEVLRRLAEKVQGRIVVNAVLLSTVKVAVDTMDSMGVFREAIQVNVARSRPLAGSIMFSPLDPVTIIVGEA